VINWGKFLDGISFHREASRIKKEQGHVIVGVG
jgi:hypothetical protein